ncbi:pilus assembly protein TadC [Mycolicibacterium moriokaense]|uniref:Type II secretion system protein F n=1 Tax=Mycolicibacterium moriokaense TaxID=39691 RepID=A0AAD1M4I9_9MYCO|nr:type II secretion system F family protein [Mycolicibacterium moriokaense]MCV7040140.1 type II secretion system F family protein [Mycolicibacterium moriokaense]ORB20134.1 pilus assembly protein TadC [Mycolicibacterium moriokaense]BBX00153.1 type II secretion system protein F [Mycolicibacterium moriokaense]
MICAAILMAVAVLLAPAGARARARALAGFGPRTSIRPAVPVAPDALATASTLEVLAACLRSGMAVSTAAAATAPSAPPHLARILTRASDMLALGAEPASAWTDPAKNTDDHAEALLRLARRSAASGAALAQGVAELAGQVHDDAADSARAAAERAGVLIAGPLGLCYLPAFVCLGIVPVVAGLATDVLGSGVL